MYKFGLYIFMLVYIVIKYFSDFPDFEINDVIIVIIFGVLAICEEINDFRISFNNREKNHE